MCLSACLLVYLSITVTSPHVHVHVPKGLCFLLLPFKVAYRQSSTLTLFKLMFALYFLETCTKMKCSAVWPSREERRIREENYCWQRLERSVSLVCVYVVD